MDEQKLIQTILSNPVLKGVVDSMVERTGALNLVRPDWEEVLEKNELYQKHKRQEIRFSKGNTSRDDKVMVRNIIGMNNYYNVIVAGYWSLGIDDGKRSSEVVLTPSASRQKDTTIICRLCSPLAKLGLSMSENPRQQYADNCRFFIDKCDPAFCRKCKDAMDKIGVDFRNNWCILKTRVFDGESVKNMFKLRMENAFGSACSLGILHLQIMSRCTYGENSYKIGGTCREMILFKESSLVAFNEPLDLDCCLMNTTSGAQLQSCAEYPSITYPLEEDSGVCEGIPRNVQKRSSTDEDETCPKKVKM